MKIISFASTSSGNCYLIKDEETNTNILVDIGIKYRELERGLADHGISISDINHLILTHSHVDHIKGLKTFYKHNNLVKIYTHDDCYFKVCDDIIACRYNAIYSAYPEELDLLRGSETFGGSNLVTMKLKPFFLSHDVVNIGFVLTRTEINCGVGSDENENSEGEVQTKIGFLTDTGIVSENAIKELADLDFLIIEANYDEDMLARGRYPDFLKNRISSFEGHLSNSACADAISKIISQNKTSGRKKKPLQIFLAHLSENNNFPTIAIDKCIKELGKKSFRHGKDFLIDAFYYETLNQAFDLSVKD